MARLTGLPLGVAVDDTAADASRMWWWAIVAAVVVVAAVWWWRRRSGRRRPRRPAGRDVLARVDRLLLETDDAVYTSSAELESVATRLGGSGVDEFAGALSAARADVTASMWLRRGLPDTDVGQRRAKLAEIVHRCTEANTRLDEVSADFDQARGLVTDPGSAVAELESELAGLDDRVNRAARDLDALARRYTDSALVGVGHHVDDAAARLRFARARITDASAAANSRPREAAGHVRAAEEALTQARWWCLAVDRRAEELAAASRQLAGLLSDAGADIAQAEAIGAEFGSSPAVDGLVTRTADALDEARRAVVSGRYDPLRLSRRVRRAAEELDKAMSGSRDAGQRRAWARSWLDSASRDCAAAIAVASDYVATHRGGVALPARLALLVARRDGDRARGWTSDPVAALASAESAWRWAARSWALARRDVAGFDTPETVWADDGRSGAVLGGILVGGLFTGVDGVSGSRGARLVPGSFGGGGTRARLGADVPW